MAFHVVYSRHYWDYEDGNGTFDNSWTIYRNVPFMLLKDFDEKKETIQ